jgi:hypothetical protein
MRRQIAGCLAAAISLGSVQLNGICVQHADFLPDDRSSPVSIAQSSGPPPVPPTQGFPDAAAPSGSIQKQSQPSSPTQPFPKEPTCKTGQDGCPKKSGTKHHTKKSKKTKSTDVKAPPAI